MTVLRKIVVSYALVLTIMGTVLLAAAFAIVIQFMGFLLQSMQADRLEEIAVQLQQAYRTDSQWRDVEREALPAVRQTDSLLIIHSSEGQRSEERQGANEGQGANKGSAAIRLGELGEREIAMFGLQQKLATADGEHWAVYYVNDAIHYVGMFRYVYRDSLIMLLVAGMAIFLLLSFLVSYILARQLTAPLSRMAPFIARLGKGDFRSKVPVTTTDEYGQIAVALNRMATELGEAEQARKNLTADVAHELRTPLTIVAGKLDYLQQRMEPIQPEQLLPLQDECIRLQRLVNDLRELSTAEAGELKLRKEWFDIGSLLQRIVEKVEGEAAAKQITVRLELSPEHPRQGQGEQGHEGQRELASRSAGIGDGDGSGDSGKLQVLLDRDRITQAVLNLLMNAIQYTPNGGIVTVHLGEQADHLKIIVSDNGEGIAPEHLPNIFRRFHRAGRTSTSMGSGSWGSGGSGASSGSGLGLAIAAEYVRAHGGTISASSVVGQGSSFEIMLPVICETQENAD